MYKSIKSKIYIGKPKYYNEQFRSRTVNCARERNFSPFSVNITPLTKSFFSLFLFLFLFWGRPPSPLATPCANISWKSSHFCASIMRIDFTTYLFIYISFHACRFLSHLSPKTAGIWIYFVRN